MISIIVPIYNVEKFLPTTVESILQQEGYSDWELILVDDGSKDGSPALCDKFAASDPRIKVVHKPNGGLSSARNAGIEVAKGSFLLFLDGDDCLDSSTLKVLHQTIKEHPGCDFIQFRYEEVLPAAPFGHKASERIENYTELYHEQDFFQQLYHLGGVAASACTKLIKRSSLGELRFKVGIIHEDELFTTQLLARCHQVGYCTNEFYKYAMRGGSIQHTAFSPKRLDAVRVREDRLAYLELKGYKKEYDLFRSQLISNLYILWNDAYKVKDAESCKWLEDKFKQYGGKQTHLTLTLKHNFKKTFKPFIQKLRNARIKWNNKRTTFARRRQLLSTDFSIISNNCWGGLVYQYFGLPYTSPTVGLFIMDDDYIKFLERLDYYLSLSLEFITMGQSRYREKLISESTAKTYYPIARLDDIEIHFMHYHSEEEARTKWEYRKTRINKDRLLVKMSQQSANDRTILDRFAALPYKNKICFTEFEHVGPEFVYIPELKHLNIQGGDETPYVIERLNLVEFINKIDITQSYTPCVAGSGEGVIHNFLNYRTYLLRCKVKQYRIRNKQFTLIADNCLAGNIYHDLNVPFQTPFINGGCDCEDYLKLLSDIEHYLHSGLNFEKHPTYDFPYARIDDIHYRFRHYHSEDEVLKAWERRIARVNLDNLFVVLTEKEDCTYDVMYRFDKLPFKNKIIITHIPYPQLKSARYIPGFEHEPCCRVLSEYVAGQCFGKRYYDGFDFVKWLNINE